MTYTNKTYTFDEFCTEISEYAKSLGCISERIERAFPLSTPTLGHVVSLKNTSINVSFLGCEFFVIDNFADLSYSKSSIFYIDITTKNKNRLNTSAALNTIIEEKEMNFWKQYISRMIEYIRKKTVKDKIKNINKMT